MWTTPACSSMRTIGRVPLSATVPNRAADQPPPGARTSSWISVAEFDVNDVLTAA